MDEKDKKNEEFTYTYAAPGSKERKRIDEIRRRYGGSSADGAARLRELDVKVCRPPMLVALVLAIVGVLAFGTGMTFSLEWDMLVPSIILGVVGIAVGLSAIPVYRVMLRRRKAKYSAEILRLSAELLGESADDSRKPDSRA